MKKGYLDNWKNIEGCQNLLFFAQHIDEQVFDYSIPSQRMTTLNSHYLCEDAISTIDDIKKIGVPEGTLKPIMEELFSVVCKDIALNKYSQKPSDLFVKRDNNSYRILTSTKELGFSDSEVIVRALSQKYFSDNEYYNLIKDLIKTIVVSNDVSKQNELFSLTKSYLTELVNGGYNQIYIYEKMNYIFFNKKTVIDSPENIENFLNIFDFKEKIYTIVFIADQSFCDITNEYKKIYNCSNKIKYKTYLDKEKVFLSKNENERYFTVQGIVSIDPFSAVEYLIKMFNLQQSFYRLNNHNVQYDISKARIIVYDENNYLTLYRHKKSSVKRAHTISNDIISDNLVKIGKAAYSAIGSSLHNGRDLINALFFHSISIDASAEENQLLNLWSVFETLLDISNQHTSDRIQQIVSYLIPVLKQKYIYTLFLQLENDIKNYSQKIYDDITKDFSDKVLSIAEWVIMDKYKESRDSILENMSDFPLLKERILYYNKEFATKEKLHLFVEKHIERVKWQIMRAYRNRNLIIHNGRKMPYLGLLIENLHSYVDDLIEFMINGYSKSNGKEQIYQELFMREIEWMHLTKNKKEATDEEIIKYMLTNF